VLLVEDPIHRRHGSVVVGVSFAVEVEADPLNITSLVVPASEIVRTETGTALEIVGTIIIIAAAEMAGKQKIEKKSVTAGMVEGTTRIEMGETVNGANAHALQVPVLPPLRSNRNNKTSLLLRTEQLQGCDIPRIAM
jgi:hypothetical protein